MPRPILLSKLSLKKLPQLVRQVQAEHPGKTVQLWAFDEHRIGLKSIRRRVWARRGHRPIAIVRDRYQWRSLNGFVHPQTGATCWFLMPTVRTDVFNQVLSAFAHEVGAGPDTLILLVLDNAGWHTSDDVRIPEGIQLAFLPPYSPELQPAERLWSLTNEPLINHPCASLDELEAIQCHRCRVLCSQPDSIRDLTRYHWWPLIR
jgi:transposase